MHKWEYYFLDAHYLNEKWQIYYNKLWYPLEKICEISNELGQQGWELVSVSSRVGSEKPRFSDWAFTYTYLESYVFKRPVP